MNVYIVTRDDVPLCATFSEQEASAKFDSTVRSGRCREASLLVVPTTQEYSRVLRQMYRQ